MVVTVTAVDAAVPLPFATVGDLQLRWRSLDVSETATAQVLLADATDLVVATCPRWTAASEATRRRVVCAVVKRAMQSGDGDVAGVGPGTFPSPRGALASESHTTGPFVDTYSYSNPDGDLFLKSSEIQSLGGGLGGRAAQLDLLDGVEAGAPSVTSLLGVLNGGE